MWRARRRTSCRQEPGRDRGLQQPRVADGVGGGRVRLHALGGGQAASAADVQDAAGRVRGVASEELRRFEDVLAVAEQDGQLVFERRPVLPRLDRERNEAMAFCVWMIGCTSAGLLSVASVPSAWNDAVTPAELMPCHVKVETVTMRATLRTGFATPAFEMSMVGSIVSGNGKPVEPTPSARSSSTRFTACTAACSRSVNLRVASCGCGSIFRNACRRPGFADRRQ